MRGIRAGDGGTGGEPLSRWERGRGEGTERTDKAREIPLIPDPYMRRDLSSGFSSLRHLRRRGLDLALVCLIQEVRSRESRGLERPWAKKLKVRRPIDHRTPSSCATIAVPGCAAFQLYTNQHHCALNIPGVWGQSPQVIMPCDEVAPDLQSSLRSVSFPKRHKQSMASRGRAKSSRSPADEGQL